jgi:hypothetical protein
MAAGPSASESGYEHVGGHSFKMREGHSIGHLTGAEDATDIPGVAGELENVTACQPCHIGLTEFNRLARADYDGDGVQEGIEDEVKGLLKNLADKIKGVDALQASLRLTATTGTMTDGDGAIVPAAFSWNSPTGMSAPPLKCTLTAEASDGTPQAGEKYTNQCTCTTIADTTLTCNTTGTTCSKTGTDNAYFMDPAKFQDNPNYYSACNLALAPLALRAAVWNHNLIVYDATLGIHNAAFSIQVLQKTYDALSADFATATPNAGKTYKAAFPLAVLR